MYHLLRRGAQHLLVALILVSADEFWSFLCQFIGVFQVYASVYDTSDRHRRPTMCTATSTWLVAALPVGPAGLAGAFGLLGVRRVAWPPGCPPVRVLGWFDEFEEDRPPTSFRSRTG